MRRPDLTLPFQNLAQISPRCAWFTHRDVKSMRQGT
jgi:hypothetical protein